MSYRVNTTSDENGTVYIRVSGTGPDYPAIITTPFTIEPKLICDVCGKEHAPEEGGWISIYSGRKGYGKSYNFCPKCFKEIVGMISMMIQTMKEGKKE